MDTYMTSMMLATCTMSTASTELTSTNMSMDTSTTIIMTTIKRDMDTTSTAIKVFMGLRTCSFYEFDFVEMQHLISSLVSHTDHDHHDHHEEGHVHDEHCDHKGGLLVAILYMNNISIVLIFVIVIVTSPLHIPIHSVL